MSNRFSSDFLLDKRLSVIYKTPSGRSWFARKDAETRFVWLDGLLFRLIAHAGFREEVPDFKADVKAGDVFMENFPFEFTVSGLTFQSHEAPQLVSAAAREDHVDGDSAFPLTRGEAVGPAPTRMVFVSSSSSAPTQTAESGSERIKRLREQLELSEDEATEVLGWLPTRLPKLRRMNEELIAEGKKGFLPTTLYRQSKSERTRKSKKGREYKVKGKVFYNTTELERWSAEVRFADPRKRLKDKA